MRSLGSLGMDVESPSALFKLDHTTLGHKCKTGNFGACDSNLFVAFPSFLNHIGFPNTLSPTEIRH